MENGEIKPWKQAGPDQSAVTLETFHGGKYSFDPAAIVVQIVLCERL